MSASVQLGVLFAVATAAGSMLGFLFKHRGAVRAPEVAFRRPIYSTFVLFRSGWYTIGVIVALGSWFFHVAALALAPISLVQSVIAGGLVLLTVFADRIFGIEVRRREWIGVAMAAGGLAFLAATMEGWTRFQPAQEWLDRLAAGSRQFRTTTGSTAPTAGANPKMNEALFKEFLEWRRKRGSN